MHPDTRRRVGWILGLGFVTTALVVGAALALRAAGGGDGSANVSSGTVPPITGPIGTAAPVGPERISVTASSSLAPDGSITYGPGNTVDGDLETAWNSDAPESELRGQRLTYRFTEPVDLEAIRFVNGYAKSAEIYVANHRIREVRIETDRVSQLVSLLDTSDSQEITFDFGYTSKVVLEVVEIFPGTGFDNPDLTADLALTEIGFLAVQR
jgi:hypothetical protein